MSAAPPRNALVSRRGFSREGVIGLQSKEQTFSATLVHLVTRKSHSAQQHSISKLMIELSPRGCLGKTPSELAGPGASSRGVFLLLLRSTDAVAVALRIFFACPFLDKPLWMIEGQRSARQQRGLECHAESVSRTPSKFGRTATYRIAVPKPRRSFR